MDETEKAQARAILAKPSREWSKQENADIYVMIKKHGRDILKALRNEALLDD